MASEQAAPTQDLHCLSFDWSVILHVNIVDKQEDLQHVLEDCAEYQEERQLLFRISALIGLPNSSTQELLLPNGPHRLAQKGFKALLVFLRETGLEHRL